MTSTWTKEKPTTPGHWWYRYNCLAVVVPIILCNGVLGVSLANGVDVKRSLTNITHIPLSMWTEGEWSSEPIEEPKEG